MPPLNKENWKERFDDKYKIGEIGFSGTYSIDSENTINEADISKLKDFISSILDSQESQVRKSCAEIARGMKREHYALEWKPSWGVMQRIQDKDLVSSHNVACEKVALSIEQGNK